MSLRLLLYRISFVLLLPYGLGAQNDSTLLLEPERLTERDILPRDQVRDHLVALSATRSLEAVDDLPFTTVVFTAEDILRNGFVTLADVMKAAPGIQVSQPGNAVEGETFMVRGLSGNQYMKVLINDIPVRPSVALGMPIGAQLPIRQAERIEIVYGPVGAIYGDESCAGVVNIILKESERPVYTQADLSFGRFGYNSLDLMFGGKIGKDKKIFRFSIYGSSTIRERTDVYYDQDIYNANHYLPLGLKPSVYLGVPNFRPSTLNFQDSFPLQAQMPHESRLFGINLTWRGIHFTYQRMLRYDHTSLGMSPLAAGYANPSNRLAERIETYALGFKRQKKRRTTHTNLSFERYKIDQNSSSTIIFDGVSAASYLAYGGPQQNDTVQRLLLQQIYSNLNSQDRFSTANGIDIRLESRMSVLIGERKRIQFDAGAQWTVGIGVPLFSYNSLPVDVGIDGNIFPNSFQPVSTFQRQEFNFSVIGFSQLAWHGKKLHIIGGGSAGLVLSHEAVLAPRLGVLYHIDSSWTVRANVATGFRQPNMYANYHTFQIRPSSYFQLYPGNQAYIAEKSVASEFAVKYTQRLGGSIEGILFWQQANNLYRPGFFEYDSGTQSQAIYGFKNTGNPALTAWGLQGILRTRDGVIDFGFNAKRTKLTNRMEFFTQYMKGRESFGGYFPNTDEIRNAPKWQQQFRYYFKAGKKFEMVFAYVNMSSRLSKASILETFYQMPARPRLKGYGTWDVMTRLYLSNHFLVYFQLQNAFDRHYGGIDATGTIDDLWYNPQQGRQWRLGVNYNMN